MEKDQELPVAQASSWKSIVHIKKEPIRPINSPEINWEKFLQEVDKPYRLDTFAELCRFLQKVDEPYPLDVLAKICSSIQAKRLKKK